MDGQALYEAYVEIYIRKVAHIEETWEDLDTDEQEVWNELAAGLTIEAVLE
jgi:hypothetical protein